MNKVTLAGKVAEKLNITMNDAKIIVDVFIRSIKNTLANGDRIEIRGFCIFKVVRKKSSIRRNPKTGEKVVVQPKNVVVFKPGEELQDIVNS